MDNSHLRLTLCKVRWMLEVVHVHCQLSYIPSLSTLLYAKGVVQGSVLHTFREALPRLPVNTNVAKASESKPTPKSSFTLTTRELDHFRFATRRDNKRENSTTSPC